MKTISNFPLLRTGKALCCLVILLLLSGQVEATIPGGTFELSWPINRAVIQRNSSNQASFLFAGQFVPFGPGPECPAFEYFYKIERLNLDNGSYHSDQVSGKNQPS